MVCKCQAFSIRNLGTVFDFRGEREKEMSNMGVITDLTIRLTNGHWACSQLSITSLPGVQIKNQEYKQTGQSCFVLGQDKVPEQYYTDLWSNNSILSYLEKNIVCCIFPELNKRVEVTGRLNDSKLFK